MLRSRRLVWVAAVWLAGMLGQYLVYFELRDALWVLSYVVTTLPLAVVALVLIAVSLRRCFDRSSRAMGVSIILVVIITGYLSWFTWLGFDSAIRLKLLRCERWYDSQVHLVQSGGVPWEASLGCGPRTDVDPGPPTRLAFSWGGIVDNWYGIVFDPTGDVLKVNDPTHEGEVNMLFGGRMVYAEHMWGSWYFCSFT